MEKERTKKVSYERKKRREERHCFVRSRTVGGDKAAALIENVTYAVSSHETKYGSTTAAVSLYSKKNPFSDSDGVINSVRNYLTWIILIHMIITALLHWNK